MARRRIALSLEHLPQQAAAGPVAASAQPAPVKSLLMDRILDVFIWPGEVRQVTSYVPSPGEETRYAAIYSKTFGRTPSRPDLMSFTQGEKAVITFDPRMLLHSAIHRQVAANSSSVTPLKLRSFPPQYVQELNDGILSDSDRYWLRKQLNHIIDRLEMLDIGYTLARSAIDYLGDMIAAMPENFRAIVYTSLTASGAATPEVFNAKELLENLPSRCIQPIAPDLDLAQRLYPRDLIFDAIASSLQIPSSLLNVSTAPAVTKKTY